MKTTGLFKMLRCLSCVPVILLLLFMVSSSMAKSLTDSYTLVSAVVQVRSAEVRLAGEDSFTPVPGFAPSNMPLSLLQEDIITDLLLEIDMAPGVYDALRVFFEPVEIVVRQGEEERIITEFRGSNIHHMDSVTVKLAPPLVIITQITQDLILSIDWADAFVPQGNAKTLEEINSFSILPIVRAINISTAGTLNFQTFSDNETPDDLSDDVQLEGVDYELYDSTVNPQVFLTGTSGTLGLVQHDDIPAGTYFLHLIPPAGHAEETLSPVEIIIYNKMDLGRITIHDNDYDDDGYAADVDCNDDNNLFWHGETVVLPLTNLEFKVCTMKPYDCDYSRHYVDQCLPMVTNVEEKLDDLAEHKTRVNQDRHSWAKNDGSSWARPGRSAVLGEPVWDFPLGKKHNQSIQYIDYGLAPPERFIVTSISDETDADEAAVQLIRTFRFGQDDYDGTGLDTIVAQQLLEATDVSDFNHPGGSQLIGNYLFLALEDFTVPFGEPTTGVWEIDPLSPRVRFLYNTATNPVTDDVTVQGDYHQSTAAVTRLEDGTFLLAACVYEDCDYINFYKSHKTTLETDPGFTFFDQWQRTPLNPGPEKWSDCPPQNMNFAVQRDDAGGTLYLVLFGGEGAGLDCTAGTHDDYLYGYRVSMVSTAGGHYDMQLTHTNKVDVLPNDDGCPVTITSLAPFLHDLNFLAGSGLWLRPDDKDRISYMVTEHYDTCDSPVNIVGKTLWGVSENWDDPE